VSKYFNETQKTEELLAQEDVIRRQDITSILQDLRKADSPGDSSDVNGPQSSLPPTPGQPDVAYTLASPDILSGHRAGHYAMEAYRALRTRLMRLQASKGLHSVAISSATPGEGKTITTINLGLCYSQLHEMPVLLIDADLRSRRLSQFFKSPRAAGLAEVLSGEAAYEDVVQRTDHLNLHLLMSGLSVASPPELFTGGAWGDLLGKCKAQFKLILIDAPPVRPLADFELICAGCDGFLMVVRAHQTQREQLRQIAGQIDSKKLVGVVLNRTNTFSRKGYYGQYGSNPS
jgi:protein-tyrosine kinase